MRSRFVVAGLALASIVLVSGCGGSGDNALIDRSSRTFAGAAAAGSVDGVGESARFNNPVNLARDADGNIWVCDFDNDLIRKITPNGTVTTVVNDPAFQRPFGITFAGSRLFVQTDGNDLGERDATTGTIWEIDTATGTPTVIARNLGRPRGLAALPDGRIVMSDIARHIIRILEPDTATVTFLAGLDGVAAYGEGVGSAARFNRPYGMCVLPDETILVADQENNRIRRVDLDGRVTTFAGTGAAGYKDSAPHVSLFNGPQSVKIDSTGRIYVGDNRNFRFRLIRDDKVSTVAGNGVKGFSNNDPLQAQFFGMEGFDLDDTGTVLYIADGTGGEDGQPYHRIRRISLNN